MKLTKNCKLLLDEINKIQPDNNGIYYIVRSVAEHADLPYTYDVYRGVLNTLADCNAIQWADKQKTAFLLNVVGREYKQLDRLEKKERWKERLVGFVFAMLIWGLQLLISKYI